MSNFDFTKTLLSGNKQYIDKITNDIAEKANNPDWNNLKNRPFYEEPTETSILSGTYEFEMWADFYGSTLPYTELTIGVIYDVIFDGITYSNLECRASENPDIKSYLGSSYDELLNDNHEYNFTIYQEVEFFTVYTTSTESSHSIEIIEKESTIKTLDSKYIPAEFITEKEASGTADSKVSEHNTSETSHSDIRLLIEGLTTRLNALADSDDTTLDQMSEVVAYIKSNKTLIEAITTNKVSVSDIVDNLTTSASNKPLSAKQGVALKALIDAIVVPKKTSQLTNDSGFLTEHQDISRLAPKATTLSGYGITDGATKEQFNQLSEENAELKGDLIDTVKGKEDTLLLSLVSGTTYKKTFNFSCNAGDIITFTLEDKSILTDSFFICISTDTETDIIIFSDTGEKAYIMPYNCNEFTVFVTGSYINSTGEISIGIKKTGYNSRFLENEKRINTLENSTKVIGDYIFVTDNSSMKEALKTGGTIVIPEGRTNITEIIEVPVNKFISIQGVSKNSFLWFAQNAQLKFTSGDDSRATVEFKNLTLHTTATRSIPIIACDGISCPTFIGVESQLNAVKGAINDIEIKNGTRLFIDACVFRHTRISITDNSDNKIQNSWIWSQTQEQAIKLIRAGNTTIHNVDIVPCLTYNIDNWLKYSDFTSEQFDNAKNGCGIYAEKCSELSIDNCLFDGGVVNGNDLNTARMVVAYYCSGLTISNCKTYNAKNDVIVIKDCYTSKIVNNSFSSCNILKTGGRAIAVYKGDITQPEIIISGNTFNTMDLDNLDLTGLVKSPLVYIESGLYPIKMVISDNLIWTKSGADGSMYKSISKIFDIDYNYQNISLEDNKSTVGVFRVNKNLSISSGETSVEVSYSMEQIPRNIVITARNSNGTKVFVETVTNTNCKFSIPEIMDTSADFYVDISY